MDILKVKVSLILTEQLPDIPVSHLRGSSREGSGAGTPAVLFHLLRTKYPSRWLWNKPEDSNFIMLLLASVNLYIQLQKSSLYNVLQ